ncbi:hypothetical protein CEXT_52681 [Caerostris extrusa]|uniref:Uncharacterized protein n=1 Tax=Caerostris extrusa TaxID=172846 RepID=A0AAV4TMM9_CAEEX|nr:hypothetical protein CEXT_52681 [Caerostris extrusa]
MIRFMILPSISTFSNARCKLRLMESPDVKTRISQMRQQVPGADYACRETKPGNGIITLVSSRPGKECSSAVTLWMTWGSYDFG